MPHCVVKGCPNRTSAKSKYQTDLEKKTKLTFHRFPKKESRRLLWMNYLRLTPTAVPKSQYICSLHFTEESFDRTSASCVRLRDHAMPSLYLPDVVETNEKYIPPEATRDSYSLTNDTALMAVTYQLPLDEPMLKELNDTLQSRNVMLKRPRESANICDVDISKRQRESSMSTDYLVKHSRTSETSTQTIFDIESLSIPKATCERATSMSPEQTQYSSREALLRKAMRHQQETSRKKIQALQKKNQRRNKRIAALKSALNEIRAKNLLAEEHDDILKTLGGSNVYSLKRLVAKTANKVKGKNL